MKKRATAQSGKNKEKKIENIRRTCVGLGNSVLCSMVEEGIDMRKEVTNHFCSEIWGCGGKIKW